MTKDEALTLALEALENISTALREDDVLGSDIEMLLNAAAAVRVALAHDDEDAIIIQYHESTIKWLEKRIEELTAQTITEEHIAKVNSDIDLAVNKALAQPEQEPVAWEQFHEHLMERNFCPRCGKRTTDPTTIHTCTPPRGTP